MSNTVVDSIVTFNQRILEIDQRPVGMMNVEEVEHTLDCLNEEVDEFSLAASMSDVVLSIDSLIDLIYFAVGAMYKFGLTKEQIEECILAVHEANMTKRRGVVERRAVDGAADAVKPEGWQSPENRIAKILGIN